MNSEPMSPRQAMTTGALLLVGLILGVRLCWQAYAGWPRGTPQTPGEFRKLLSERHAIDRENFERDWIASGTPVPKGGFDSLFKAQGRHSHATDAVFAAPAETVANSP